MLIERIEIQIMSDKFLMIFTLPFHPGGFWRWGRKQFSLFDIKRHWQYVRLLSDAAKLYLSMCFY